MNRRSLTALLGAALLLAAPALQAQEVWRMYTYATNANVAAGAGAQRIADRITAESGGKIRVQHFFGGSLPIKATDIAQAVSDDVVQIATDGFYAGAIPYGSFLRLPMLVQSADDYEKAFPVVKGAMEAQFSRIGVRLLGYYTWPASTIFTTFPLQKAADLAGRKIRQGDPSTTEYLKSFDASPIVLGTSDVAPALQQGVIHGVVTTAGGGARLWEGLLTHNYRIPTYASASLALVNKSRFEKLSPDLQALVSRIVTEETRAISAANQKDEVTALAQYKAKGMVVTEARSDDLALTARRMEPSWAAWAKKAGPDAEKHLADIRRALGR